MGYIISCCTQDPPDDITLNPGNDNYPVEAGTFVETIVLYPENDDVLNVGTTPGGTELAEAFAMDAGENNSVIVQRKFKDATTIYFTGITGDILTTIYKR